MNLKLAAWASRGKIFITANFEEHTIYLSLMLHQSLVRLVLIHSIFTYHKSYSSLDIKHESIGGLALSQFNPELWERDFLWCPINIEVHDLAWAHP
jgi:hypothetical protein